MILTCRRDLRRLTQWNEAEPLSLAVVPLRPPGRS